MSLCREMRGCSKTVWLCANSYLRHLYQAPLVLACTQGGISVADLGEGCPNKQVRNAVQAMGWFCGRYRLDSRPEHSTETSVVYLATEFMSNNPSGRRVAIKFMSDQAQHENEIAVRKGIATRF